MSEQEGWYAEIIPEATTVTLWRPVVRIPYAGRVLDLSLDLPFKSEHVCMEFIRTYVVSKGELSRLPGAVST